MVMQHSRSRLSGQTTPTTFSEKVTEQFRYQSSKLSQNQTILKPLSPQLRSYLVRWPQLIISASVFFALYRLVSTYYPEQLAHFLLPNSYLTVLSLWFIGQWYLWSFLLHHTKRSLLAATICTLWLFTRLQQIVSPIWFWLLLLTGPLILGFTWDFLQRRRV